MKKKIIKFLNMFGSIMISIICFVIGEVIIRVKYIDTSFINQLDDYEKGVIVFAVSGVIFLFIGLSNLIYYTIYYYRKGDDKS